VERRVEISQPLTSYFASQPSCNCLVRPLSGRFAPAILGALSCSRDKHIPFFLDIFGEGRCCSGHFQPHSTIEVACELPSCFPLGCQSEAGRALILKEHPLKEGCFHSILSMIAGTLRTGGAAPPDLTSGTPTADYTSRILGAAVDDALLPPCYMCSLN